MNNKTYQAKPKKPLTAQEFFNFAYNHHIEWMIKVKKPAFPFYMQLYRKSTNAIELVVVADCPASPLDYARSIIEKRDPDYFIILSEAYMRFINPFQAAELDKNYQYGDIKKSPDRIEILQVVGKSKDGKSTFSRTMKMIRNEKKEVIGFKNVLPEGVHVDPKSRKIP